VNRVAGTALVVGGGSGIGAALVAGYRARGRDVVVWDIAGDRDVTCDVARPEQIDDALAQTVERGGLPAEVTVTAGVGHSCALVDEDPQAWDRVLAVNTRGPWLVMRAVARALLAAEVGGSMVAVSSVSGRLADRTMGAYCASKAALNMLVRVAAREWAPSIRVNAIAPGVTVTPMLGGAPRDGGYLRGIADRTALGDLGDADDVAQAVVAVHELSWVTGQVLEVDGGLGLHSPINP
jgi:NAD(P)-dependent dehydrogenase (short-subunit alcohol dehydrogenase family)